MAWVAGFVTTAFVGLVLSLQTACAPPCEWTGWQQMQDALLESLQSSFGDPPADLRDAVVLGTVTGGQTTYPPWISKVGTGQFTLALDTSLRNSGILAAGKPKFRLNADLVSIQETPMGPYFILLSSVNYWLEPIGPQRGFATTVVYRYEMGTCQLAKRGGRVVLPEEVSLKANIQEFMRQAFAFYAEA